MRKFYLLVSVLATGLFVNAQSRPFGFEMENSSLDQIERLELPTFDHAQLLAEDTRKEEMGGRTDIGRLINISISADDHGVWTTLPNGDRMWQLRFHSPDALGMCVFFSDLYLPQGSSLYAYPIHRRTFEGPFTLEDCNASGKFVVGEIVSNDAILEYYEPAGVIGNPRLQIRAFSHIYRYVYDYSTEESEDSRGGGSQACEVDVNCPEGANWTAQRDAVVRLLITSGNTQGLCSGALVNTTAMDCRKYLLTAMHCGEDVSDADWEDCVVKFNYERSGCGTGSSTTSHNKIGVTHLADSDDNGGQSGSDFLLLEIQDEIPASYTPFFAGWDANATTPPDVVGIHHPAGDRKKISTATNVISSTWQAPGYHWQVKWMATITNWGVTEGGSSGSPIFNPDKRIVGQLTGGFSCCTDGGCEPVNFTGPAEPDYYGKMDKNWDDNANAPDQKLKVWLDPLNTGATTMDGSYVKPNNPLPCDPNAIVGVKEIEFAEVKVFPTNAQDAITVQSERYRDIREIRIYGTAGELIYTGSMINPSISIDVSSFGSGMYYISFIQNEGYHLTRKFTVQH